MNKLKRILLIPTALLAILLMSSCQSKKAETTTQVKTEETGWVVTQAATCTEDGIQTKTLASGKKETKVIKATGHKITEDEAVAATCTEDGLTAGSHCASCGAVLQEQEVIPAHHVPKTKAGVAATCTRAGRSESQTCTVCGETIAEEEKIRPLGHKFLNGYCAYCNQQAPDCVELNFANFGEGSPTTFITTAAYAGGSTVTFSAYVPDGLPEGTWWGIAWTDNPQTANIYDCASTEHAKPLMKDSVKGKWATYSVTLPDDGKQYYIYFGGPAGYANWNGQCVLLDDVVITGADGTVLAKEDFSGGLENCIFTVNQPSGGTTAVRMAVSCQGGHEIVTQTGYAATCTEDGLTDGTYCAKCGKVINAQTVIPSAGGHTYNDSFVCTKCGKTYENIAIQVAVNRLNEFSNANMITAKAYAGGSTIRVRVKGYDAIPENAWWGFAWTTDKNSIDIYNVVKSGCGYNVGAVTDKWKTVEFSLPDDGGEYYIYVGGPREVESVWIDDFAVYDKAGNLVEACDFDNGYVNSTMFDFGVYAADGRTKIIDNFVWEYGHTVVEDSAVAATCLTAGHTAGRVCAVCGKSLSVSTVIPALQPETGHHYVDGVCTVCGHAYENRSAAVYTKYLRGEKGVLNFVTAKTYKGGTTVTFDAYVPANTGWWGLGWTTDKSAADVYYAASTASGQPLKNAAKLDCWATYTVTLPDDGKDYYIFIGAPAGEGTADKPILVDNFKFTVGTETVDTCLFDDGLSAEDVTRVFDIKTVGTDENIAVDTLGYDYYSPCKGHHTVVEIPAVEATCTQKGQTAGSKCSVCDAIIVQPTELPYLSPDGCHHYEDGECIYCHQQKPNAAVAIYTKYLCGGKGMLNFVTAKTYKGGTTITFDAYVPANTGWWGLGWTTDKSAADVYYAASTASGQPLKNAAKLDCWATYTVTLPDDGKDYYIFIGAPAGEGTADKPILVDNFKFTVGTETVDACDFDDGITAGTVTDIFKIDTAGTASSVAVEEVTYDYYSPCKGHHTAVEIPAVAATCTTKGKTAGSKCSVCGEIITAPQETEYLSPDGCHHYEGGECIYCHQQKPNAAVAIYTKYLRGEKGVLNFVTAKTYKGGTTVTFDAYVPANTGWWGLGWTTDKSAADVYYAASTASGQPLKNAAKLDCWATYTVTLPDDGKDYYIFIGAPAGEGTADKPILVDNFKFTVSGEVADECDFDDGITAGAVTDIFKIDTAGSSSNIAVAEVTHDYYDPCKNGHTAVEIPAVAATCTTKGKTAGSKCSVCGEIITAPQETEYLSPDGCHHYEDGECIYCHQAEANKALSIDTRHILEGNPVNLITKNKYAGGTTITFNAYIPSAMSNSWWGMAWTTDASTASIYNLFAGLGTNLKDTAKFGKWASYTVTLPDDGKEYYVYFCSAGNEIGANCILLDDFVIQNKAGTTVATCDFSDGLTGAATTSIFTVITKGSGTGTTVITEGIHS